MPSTLAGHTGTMSAVTVFCGSSEGRSPAHRATIAALGRELAGRGIRVVYGGARVGTMGALADAVLGAGGHITGVIPRGMVHREIAHEGLSELHVVATMHERKALMAELADGFIAAPGGLGTLEEWAEIVTWAQLGEHAKPVVLLNTDGFYDPLLAFVDHAAQAGFVGEGQRRLVRAEADPAAAVDAVTGPPNPA